MPSTEPKQPAFLQLHQFNSTTSHAQLATGLGATPAWFSPKYFYDQLGSKLFEAITCTEEYYPTRTEAAIFSQHLADMANAVPANPVLIDLGAGNCQKAARLFQAFAPCHYVAVDVSADFLRESLGQLAQQHPGLPMSGVGMDFSSHLELPPALHLPEHAPRVFSTQALP